MQAAVPSVTRIPFGTPIIGYNQWTGFETDRFKDQFKWLSGKEVSELPPETTVYVDVDPLHPNGKVYGSVKGKITAINSIDERVFVSYLCEGIVAGTKQIDLDSASTNFALAISEDILADILDELPQAKVIDQRFS